MFIISQDVKLGTVVYSPEIEPVAIVFKSDEERISFAKQLLDMPPKKDVRIYAQFPSTCSQDYIKTWLDSAESFAKSHDL